MRTFFAACFLSLPILTACGAMPPLDLEGEVETKRPLKIVELDYPNVTFTFLSTGEEHRSDGAAFPPPKTIDCSRLRLKSDAFKDAIEAGALLVKIQTPRQVKQIIKNEDGKETVKVVNIKPFYGGVLALCNVSENAIGPDSRRYWIRDLDEYLIKGKDGLVSVRAAVLSHDNQFDVLGELIEKRLGVPYQYTSSGPYSWMLWLTDRTTTFTDYEAEVAKRKASTPSATAPVQTP
jgi:hypothetical protein